MPPKGKKRGIQTGPRYPVYRFCAGCGKHYDVITMLYCVCGRKLRFSKRSGKSSLSRLNDKTSFDIPVPEQTVVEVPPVMKVKWRDIHGKEYDRRRNADPLLKNYRLSYERAMRGLAMLGLGVDKDKEYSRKKRLQLDLAVMNLTGKLTGAAKVKGRKVSNRSELVKSWTRDYNRAMRGLAMLGLGEDPAKRSRRNKKLLLQKHSPVSCPKCHKMSLLPSRQNILRCITLGCKYWQLSKQEQVMTPMAKIIEPPTILNT